MEGLRIREQLAYDLLFVVDVLDATKLGVVPRLDGNLNAQDDARKDQRAEHAEEEDGRQQHVGHDKVVLLRMRRARAEVLDCAKERTVCTLAVALVSVRLNLELCGHTCSADILSCKSSDAVSESTLYKMQQKKIISKLKLDPSAR